MRRGLVLVLFVFSAFWQVIAIAGQATAFGTAEEAAHAMLHWQEESHHHHDDGTVTQDDSDESVTHVVADGCLSASAIGSSASLRFIASRAPRPEMADQALLPSLPSEGLRRPPRLTT